MSDEPERRTIRANDDPEGYEAARNDRVSEFLECELGRLSLGTEAYNAHAMAIMQTFADLSGNDCLWVLGAVLGSVIADAPPDGRTRMLIAFHALTAYSLERAIATKAATRHHEEGHA